MSGAITHGRVTGWVRARCLRVPGMRGRGVAPRVTFRIILRRETILGRGAQVKTAIGILVLPALGVGLHRRRPPGVACLIARRLTPVGRISGIGSVRLPVGRWPIFRPLVPPLLSPGLISPARLVPGLPVPLDRRRRPREIGPSGADPIGCGLAWLGSLRPRLRRRSCGRLSGFRRTSFWVSGFWLPAFRLCSFRRTGFRQAGF